MYRFRYDTAVKYMSMRVEGKRGVEGPWRDPLRDMRDRVGRTMDGTGGGTRKASLLARKRNGGVTCGGQVSDTTAPPHPIPSMTSRKPSRLVVGRAEWSRDASPRRRPSTPPRKRLSMRERQLLGLPVPTDEELNAERASRRLRRYAAATTIQAVARGWLAREDLKRMRERKLQREREQARRAALLKLEKLRTAAATAIQAAQRRHSSCVLLSDLRTMHSGRFVARLHVFLRFPRAFSRPKPGDLIMRARTGCLGCYGAQGRCLLVVVDEERRAAATIIQAVERGRAQRRRYRRWRLKANAMLMKITTKVIRLRLSVALDGLVDLKIEHAIQPRVPPTGVDSFEVSLRAVGFVAIATPKRNLARDLRQNIMRDKREGSPGRSRGRAPRRKPWERYQA